ncbi:MAG: allophanate hydrolase subunit 1 [Nocardioides sp.]|uniref:5-oxoprolinase subunit B family protein n=1 Tax=Nocardioides sp. TaxID=35761 RepID=UPI003F01D1B9
MRFLPAGVDGLLVEVGSTDQVLALHAGIEQERAAGRLVGVREVVPAARTVLLLLDPDRTTPDALRALVAGLPLDAPPARQATPLDVPVRYDGPDLDDVCDLLGMGREEFVAWHGSERWQVAFTGFAPGFGYLVRPGHRTPVPRLDAPRTRVPAGAVAMADLFTGVYPLATPGGWRIVGHTELVLFDLDAEPAATLHPGRTVRFVPA